MWPFNRTAYRGLPANGHADKAVTLDMLEARLRQHAGKLLESAWGDYVDPRERFYDDDGSRWLSLGSDEFKSGGFCFKDEGELKAARDECRCLSVDNEYAINGAENRISYVVGAGHVYEVSAKKNRAVDEAFIAECQAAIDEFVADDCWQSRQQEIRRRLDRDGEVFIRFFAGPAERTDGDEYANEGQSSLRVRFVEPWQVSTPQDKTTVPALSFGIQCDQDDAEDVRGYWIDGEYVDAGEIQHRKANVDRTAKRGCPLFWPVRKNLRAIERLDRNMMVVSNIQSAIAIIRKHDASKSAVQSFVAGQASTQHTPSVSGTNVGAAASRTQYGQSFKPGTILDASKGIDYEYPIVGVSAPGFIAIKESALRGIAARLVMPEFMLTSNAANANYSSTMVAEGPAVRMFERLQAETIEHDKQIMHRVLEARFGDRKELALIQVNAEAPKLATRDRAEDIAVDQGLSNLQALSPQTLCLRWGLDYETEQENINEHREAQPDYGLPGLDAEPPDDDGEPLDAAAKRKEKQPQGANDDDAE